MAGLQDFLTTQFNNEEGSTAQAAARQQQLAGTNFYTPPAGATPGVDWFPMDDRNLPADWAVATGPDATYPQTDYTGAATPTNISALSGGTYRSDGTTSTKPTGGIDANGVYSPNNTGGYNTAANVSALSGGTPSGFLPTPTTQTPFPTGTSAGTPILTLPDGTKINAATGQPTLTSSSWNTPSTPTNPTSSTSTTGSSPTPGSPAGTPNAPAANPLDFSALLAQYGLASQQLTNQIMPTLNQIIANMNTGYDPATLSAMRTQATSGIQKQYESAAQQMRTRLLQQGAIGAGELPGSSGDILRDFAPLDQARLDATSQANLNSILANQQEVARKQGLGMQAIQDVLGAQGQVNSMLQTAIQSGTQLNLANLDAQTRTLLAQMGITSQSQLAALQAQTQLSIAGMNNDTQKWVSQLNADTQTALANLQANTQIDINKLDNATRVQIANIQNAPGSLKNILLASVFSSLLTGGTGNKGGSTGGGILGTLTNVLIGKAKGSDSSGGWTIDPESGEEVYTGSSGTVGGNIGSSVMNALKTVGGKVASAASSIGSAVAGLMTNPITAVIGGALAAGYFLFRGTAHLKANEWVQQNQNPFDQNMANLNTQFAQLQQSGQLTKQSAQAIRDSAAGLLQTYQQQLQDYGTKGGDEAKVAKQALQTFQQWYGDNGSKWLGFMDGQIAGLKA